MAVDKFRGTASAGQAAGALALGVADAGWTAESIPLADGGEGLVDALGGANRTTTVTGPLGVPVAAPWRLDGSTAVVECAVASGLLLAGGAAGNDPLAATTRGTGELIAAAVDAGATRVVVGLGGSATTDGGRGALEALGDRVVLFGRGVEVVVACDVTTRYLDAARVFAPQKGATPAQVAMLGDRLVRTRRRLRERFGVDPQAHAGSGAAGGLAGALASAGATLRPGFDLVADHLHLGAALDGADLVITGEGRLDRTSLDGKVVGGVLRMARARGLPVVAVVGVSELGATPGLDVVSLTDRFGTDRAWDDVLGCLREAGAAYLQGTATTAG